MNLVDDKILEQVKRESIRNFESNEINSDGGDFFVQHLKQE